MNPLTQIKNTQKISREEVAAGYTDAQSWHARFKHSAYIFAGGLPFKLTDGDLLAIFSQYGEIIDVNLVRHQDTGNPRGFAFLAYEDQRSTNLAVDNLNGMKVGGRIVTVDHVDNYKRKRAEAEGRQESESDEEANIGDAEEGAQAAALLAAAGDGAQIVSTKEATIQQNGAHEDAPWASKSSIHALLNSELPASASERAAEEDPLAIMKASKKVKKEKKNKRKKEKKRKEKDAPEEAYPHPDIAGEGLGKSIGHGHQADVQPLPFHPSSRQDRDFDKYRQTKSHEGHSPSKRRSGNPTTDKDARSAAHDRYTGHRRDRDEDYHRSRHREGSSRR